MVWRLPSTCISKEFCFIFRCLYLQEISFISAFEQAGSSLGILDEIKLGFFQLQSIDIILCVDVTAIEKKLVSRNGKQRFRQFLDIGQQKILDILTGKQNSSAIDNLRTRFGALLASALRSVL